MNILYNIKNVFEQPVMLRIIGFLSILFVSILISLKTHLLIFALINFLLIIFAIIMIIIAFVNEDSFILAKAVLIHTLSGNRFVKYYKFSTPRSGTKDGVISLKNFPDSIDMSISSLSEEYSRKHTFSLKLYNDKNIRVFAVNANVFNIIKNNKLRITIKDNYNSRSKFILVPITFDHITEEMAYRYSLFSRKHDYNNKWTLHIELPRGNNKIKSELMMLIK